MLSSNAEKIYWLSRYIERAENTARLVNVNFDLLLDIPHDSVSDFIHLVEITSDLEQFNSILLDEKMFYSSSVSAIKNVVLNFVIYNSENLGSISYSLEMAKYNSRYLRTMLPKTAWEQFNKLHAEFSLSNEENHSTEVLHQIIRNSKTFFATISDAMHRDHVFDFGKLPQNLILYVSLLVHLLPGPGGPLQCRPEDHSREGAGGPFGIASE